QAARQAWQAHRPRQGIQELPLRERSRSTEIVSLSRRGRHSGGADHAPGDIAREDEVERIVATPDQAGLAELERANNARQGVAVAPAVDPGRPDDCPRNCLRADQTFRFHLGARIAVPEPQTPTQRLIFADGAVMPWVAVDATGTNVYEPADSCGPAGAQQVPRRVHNGFPEQSPGAP